MNAEPFFHHKLNDRIPVQQDNSNRPFLDRRFLSWSREIGGSKEDSLLELPLDRPAKLINFGPSDKPLSPLALEGYVHSSQAYFQPAVAIYAVVTGSPSYFDLREPIGRQEIGRESFELSWAEILQLL